VAAAAAAAAAAAVAAAAAAAAAKGCLLGAKCFHLLSPLFAAGTVVRHRRFPLNSSKTLKRNILSDVYGPPTVFIWARGVVRAAAWRRAAVERGSRRKAASAKYCINKCAGEIFMAVPNHPSTVLATVLSSPTPVVSRRALARRPPQT